MSYVQPFEVWVDGYREIMMDKLEESLSWFDMFQEKHREVYIIDNSYPSPGKIIRSSSSVK